MRLCISCVYWTLLLVSVVSSGLLFLIVASEGTQISQKPRGISQEDNIPIEDVDKDAPSESAHFKVSEIRSRPTVKTEREHFHPLESDGGDSDRETPGKETKRENNLDVLKQSLTQQPNLSQGISETGQAVVLTLVDTAAAELQSLAEPRLTPEIRSRSLAMNTTLKTITSGPIPATTTTITTIASSPTTSISLETDPLIEQTKKTGTSTLPISPLVAESSNSSTKIVRTNDETAAKVETDRDNLERKETVIVRAEQKIPEDTTMRKTEEIQEDEIKDETVKEEENLPASAELDDGAAKAKLVGGSGEDSAAVMIDGLVASGPTDHHHEDIPSFSEWAQKRLEEAEKKKTHPNASIQNPGGPGRGVGGMKVRSKNYASPDCGAKIVAVNPEARSARSVLVSTRDEYMLNTCTSRIWFVVELCEAIQAKKIELANFELFSSSPKDFNVHVSDRFPTRDWSPVGQFTAKDQRDIQSFALHPQLFGKFIKIELHSHYGSEHFCPISLFRAYGTSEFEVLETETDHQESEEDDNNEDDDEDGTSDSENSGDARNLFGSARDAVLRIVKKAAEVLVKTSDQSNKNNITKIQESIEDSIMASTFASCMTPRYMINCPNCTDDLFAGVFELLSCRAKELDAILRIPLINETLRSGELCSFYGVDAVQSVPVKNNNPTSATIDNNERLVFTDDESSRAKFHVRKNVRATFIASIYSPEYILALCNVIAAKERKLVLNTSYEVIGNMSVNSSTRIDGNAGKFDSFETNGQPRVVVSTCLPEIDSTGCKNLGIDKESKITRIQGTSIREQETLVINSGETPTTSSESLASQIKPTKALSREDMRKESSVPILEPSKDPNEGSIQAEVLTTPSPILNVATATSRITAEPAVISNPVESTTQIVTQVVTTSNLPSRETQDVSLGGENSHDNGTPLRQDNFEQETKPSKLENGEQEAKLMAQDQMSLDSILSDLKDLEGENSGIHGSANHNANIVAQPTASSTPQQKESVFLRLSNRIKALERNMSLSGQYLEELSKRYKKQVEEMQRSLERATIAMSEESRKGEEREIRRLEEISSLREELSSLTQSMEILLYDRNSWRSKLSTICQHFALIVVEIVLFMLVVSYCRRSSEFEVIDDESSSVSRPNETKRRRSAGAMSSCNSTMKKTRNRRPSEIASKIVGTYRDLMIDDGTNQESKKDKKKRRKKESNGKTMTNGDGRKEQSRLNEGMPGGTSLSSRRSSSIDSTSNHAKQLELCHTRRRPDSAPEYSGNWPEETVQKDFIDETVEDPDVSLVENTNHQRCQIEEMRLPNLSSDEKNFRKEHVNNTAGGSIFRGGGILKAAKSSSPSFMKTALGTRSKRNTKNLETGDHVVQLKSDNWEWYAKNSATRSDSPSSSMLTDGSDSVSHGQDGTTNGHHRNASNESGSSDATATQASKKEKKTGGFRKMVRKLF